MVYAFNAKNVTVESKWKDQSYEDFTTRVIEPFMQYCVDYNTGMINFSLLFFCMVFVVTGWPVYLVSI